MLLIWSSNFTITLSFFSNAISETEAALTSVERISEMGNLPQEGAVMTPATIDLDPSWPARGKLTFENVCFRYRPELPLSLDKLSFSVDPGQRVGIVG